MDKRLADVAEWVRAVRLRQGGSNYYYAHATRETLLREDPWAAGLLWVMKNTYGVRSSDPLFPV
jgi:hypothetical protein